MALHTKTYLSKEARHLPPVWEALNTVFEYLKTYASKEARHLPPVKEALNTVCEEWLWI